jgi:hypothetical protein
MKIQHLLLLIGAFAVRSILVLAVSIAALVAAFRCGQHHPTVTAAAATIQTELREWQPAAEFHFYRNEDADVIDVANVGIDNQAAESYLYDDVSGHPAPNHLHLLAGIGHPAPFIDIASFITGTSEGEATIVPDIAADGTQTGYSIRFRDVTSIRTIPSSDPRWKGQTVLIHFAPVGKYEAAK